MKYNCGLIEGKFLPPHKGHIELILFGMSMCERLVVRIGRESTDFITFDTKKNIIISNLIRMASFPIDLDKITFIDNHEEGYQQLEVDEFGTVISNEYWNLYISKISSEILADKYPVIDCVISSELYGYKIASKFSNVVSLPVKWLPYDRDRRYTTTTGTKIRGMLANYSYLYSNATWKTLLPEVKARYSKLVIVNGTEGSGKTSLVSALAASSRLYGVREYGRFYTIDYQEANTSFESSEGVIFSIQDFKNIALQQQYLIDRARWKTPVGVVVSDTDALTTMLFARYFLNEEDTLEFEDWVTPLIQQQLQAQDCYLITNPQHYLDDDGSRTLTAEQRLEFFQRMVGILTNYEVDYKILPYASKSKVRSEASTYIEDAVQKERELKANEF